MYGTVYLTGYTSLPELVVPPEVQELLEPGSPPDFLVLLPWGPVLKGLFESPTHFQVSPKLPSTCFIIERGGLLRGNKKESKPIRLPLHGPSLSLIPSGK